MSCWNPGDYNITYNNRGLLSKVANSASDIMVAIMAFMVADRVDLIADFQNAAPLYKLFIGQDKETF